MSEQYVFNEDGSIKTDNGHPLIRNDKGEEFPVNALDTTKRILSLTTENREYRKKYSALKDNPPSPDPAPSSGIPEDEFQKMKHSLEVSYQEKVSSLKSENEQLASKYRRVANKQRFMESAYIQNELSVHPEIAFDRFGGAFDENGIARYPGTDEIIYSRTNPGQPADFDEAMAQIIESDRLKDHLIRDKTKSGTGFRPGGSPAAEDGKDFFNPESPKYSLTKQAAYLRENPEKGVQYRKEFGLDK